MVDRNSDSTNTVLLKTNIKDGGIISTMITAVTLKI
jgi:hypothetical protein